mgnify:CR=1 FL=1
MTCEYRFNGGEPMTYQALIDNLSGADIDTALSILFSLSKQDAVYDSIMQLKKEHQFKTWEKKTFNSIDVLINNAGVAQNTPFDQISVEEFDALIEGENKTYKDYSYVSRYSVFPYYYHVEDNKYVYGLTAYLNDKTTYTLHTVEQGDNLDNLALKYYKIKSF